MANRRNCGIGASAEPAPHNHDQRYYTKDQVDTLFRREQTTLNEMKQDIGVLNTNVVSLQANKANKSEVESLASQVNSKANQSDLNNLSGVVANKADISALNDKADVSLVESKVDKVNDKDLISNSLITKIEEELFKVDTVADLRSLSQDKINQLLNGTVKGVQLLGYYEKGDTPAPLNYILSDTNDADDGGSIIAVQNIKLEANLPNEFNSCYFGTKYGDLEDVGVQLQNSINYAAKTNKHCIISNKGFSYNYSVELNIPIASNFSFRGDDSLPTLNQLTENVKCLNTQGDFFESLDNIVLNTSTIVKGNNTIEVTNIGQLNVDDLIWIQTTEAIGAQVTSYLKGEFFKIESINGNILTLDHNFGTDINNVTIVNIRKIFKRSNINISNIIFKGFGASNILVSLRVIQNSEFNNLYFISAQNDVAIGLDLIGYDVKVRKSTAIKCYDPTLQLGYGFNISGRNIDVIECIAKSCKHGVTVASRSFITANVKYIRCKVYDSRGQKAFDVHGGAYDCSVEYCDIYNSTGAINLRGFSGMKAINNNVYSKVGMAVQQAIVIQGEATGITEDLIIIGNYVINHANTPISASPNTTINGYDISLNTFKNCTGGAVLWNSAGNVFANKGVYSSNQVLAPIVSTTNTIICGSENHVFGNYIEANGSNGLLVTGTAAQIVTNNLTESNIIKKIGTSNFAIAITQASNSTIRFNKFIGYVNEVSRGNTGTLANNTVYSNENDISKDFALAADITTYTLDSANNKLLNAYSIQLFSNWLRDNQKFTIYKGVITNTTNFNTLLSTGYYLLGDAPTDLSFNAPVNESGILEVVNGNTQFIIQKYTSRFGKTYTRFFNVTSWTIWKRLDDIVSGSTAARPSNQIVGTYYFDTTLAKPIYWSGTNWVDSTGATV